MIRDLVHGYAESTATQDVCIIGAGAAGIVLAVELVRRGKSVVVLEGGGLTIEAESQDLCRSELAGLPHRGIHVGRFRAVGGTTLKWGGQILELDEQDFAVRPHVSGSGWPFAKADLARFYERALTLEGLGRVERDEDAVWQGIGVAARRFAGLDSYLTRWCPQPNFALLHRETLERHPLLTVWQHANVVELCHAGSKELAMSVRAKTLTGFEAKVCAREFVFCLGAIECSRFFLQPRADGVPWNRSELVGKYFQDHVDANIATVKPLDRKGFSRCFDNIYSQGFKYHPKLRLSEAEQRERETLNVAGTMVFESEAQAALSTLKSSVKKLLGGDWSEITAEEATSVVRHLPLALRQAWRYAVEHRAYNPEGNGAAIQLRVHCEQRPDSVSSITLSGERDALGLLRARLDWQIDPVELATIREFTLTAQRALAPLAVISPDERLVQLDPSFIAQCDDSNHHMGGMRMAASERNGVVDPNLRLWGMKNVSVLSSAVFPSSGKSNPTHTLLALAVRLADHLG